MPAATICQLARAAIWAGVPGRAPLARGRPRLPAGAGLGPYSTALAGSRVVRVLFWQMSAWPWKAASPAPRRIRPGNAAVSVVSIWAARFTCEAVPLPRQSRNSTGSATGEEHAGSLTTIAAITRVFPDAIFLPPCADPSYAHRACATFLPRRRKNVPPAVTVTGSLPASRCFAIRRATAAPRSSASQTAWEKNQHARRNRAAIPAAAAIATTVRRLARTIPHASAVNSARADRRLNAGASSSGAGRDAAHHGRLASQGSLTASDDLESHLSCGASLLLSRCHAPGYQTVINYHHRWLSRHARLRNAGWRYPPRRTTREPPAPRQHR